jgi:Flp pilus assembly pilin Flp
MRAGLARLHPFFKQRQRDTTMCRASRFARALATQFVSDDSGQDLIEYALLTAIIGLSGLLVVSTLSTTVGNTYKAWDAAGQIAWQPCDPAACS